MEKLNKEEIKQVIKARSMYKLKERISFKEDSGYSVKGKIHLNYCGEYECLMVKEVLFKCNKK